MTDYSDLIKRLRLPRMGLSTILEAADALEAQAKRIEELEAALKPFANMEKFVFSFEECEKARKALEKGDE